LSYIRERKKGAPSEHSDCRDKEMNIYTSLKNTGYILSLFRREFLCTVRTWEVKPASFSAKNVEVEIHYIVRRVKGRIGSGKEPTPWIEWA